MSNLPAYIRQKTTKLAQTALEGVGIGTGPHINIKGNRFALVDAAGNRQPLQTLYCDVVIFDLQSFYSKIMYPGPWDEDNPLPPICFSDNGVGPSSRAAEPQSLTCKGCPNDRFGSKISETGSEVKACRDEWKTACVVPGVARQVFRLTIPPASLKAFKGYLASFGNESYDVDDVVTRLTFVDGQNGVLAFQPIGWLNDETAASRDQAVSTGAANALLGRGDVVFAPGASAQIQQHLAQRPVQVEHVPQQSADVHQGFAPASRPAPQLPGTLLSSSLLQKEVVSRAPHHHTISSPATNHGQHLSQPHPYDLAREAMIPSTQQFVTGMQHGATTPVAPPPPPAEVLSEDGNYRWDGRHWHPRHVPTPPPPPATSQELPPSGAPNPTQPPAARRPRRTKAEMDAARAQAPEPAQSVAPPVAPFRQPTTPPSTAASFQPGAPPPPPNGAASSFGIGGGVPPNPDVSQALAGLFPPS